MMWEGGVMRRKRRDDEGRKGMVAIVVWKIYGLIGEHNGF